MTQFVAYNVALESASNAIVAGPSYTAGTAAVAIQLEVPTGGTILVKEWGVSFATSQTTQALVAMRTTSTAQTGLTAHSTTTIKPWDTNNVNAGASRLTMGTGSTGYGAVTLSTTPTTIRSMAHLYVPNAYVYQAALGDEFEVGTNAAERLQLVINAGVTSLATCWIKWIERI